MLCKRGVPLAKWVGKKADREVSLTLCPRSAYLYTSTINILGNIKILHRAHSSHAITRSSSIPSTVVNDLDPPAMWQMWVTRSSNAKLVHTVVLNSYSYSSKRALLGVILIRRSCPEARARCTVSLGPVSSQSSRSLLMRKCFVTFSILVSRGAFGQQLDALPGAPPASRLSVLWEPFLRQPHSRQHWEWHQTCRVELDLGTEDLAIEMAIGLAITHYHAPIDCADIAFVLSNKERVCQMPYFMVEYERVAPHIVSEMDSTGRTVHLWILDFDKSRSRA